MKNVKVILIHNTIAPYRHPLFEELSKKVDLMVYYCSVKHSFRKWDLWPRNYDYKYKLLPGITIKTPIGEFSFNPAIIKEVVKNIPQVIIISGYVDPTMWTAFIVGKLLKIPIIYWTEEIREPRSIVGIVTKPIRYLFIKKSNALIAQGKRTKEFLESWGVHSDRIFIAHNSVDNDLYIHLSQEIRRNRNNIRNMLGFHEKHLLLFVGQLIPRKGISDLIQIYMKVKKRKKDLALIIIGSGPLKEIILKAIQEHDLDAVYLIESGISFQDLVKYYSIADIFILPTLFDLAPLVINEAMACGLPVIVYDAAGNTDDFIISGLNGYVIRKGDVESFSESIIRVLDDERLRKRMSEESIRIITSVGSVNSTVNGFLKSIEYVLRR